MGHMKAHRFLAFTRKFVFMSHDSSMLSSFTSSCQTPIAKWFSP